MDQKCEYCEKLENDLYLVTLPCGYTVCQEHLNDDSENLCCFMCCEHSISKESCLKMKKNRDKIYKIKFLKASDSFRSKLKELKQIKGDPKYYINEIFSIILNKLDLRREEIISEVGKIFEQLYEDVNYLKSENEQYLIEKLTLINIEQIEDNLDSIDVDYENKLNYINDNEQKLFKPIFECIKDMERIKFKYTINFKGNDHKLTTESFLQIMDQNESIDFKNFPSKSQKSTRFSNSYIRELSSGELLGASFEKPENLKIWNPETGSVRELEGHKTDIECIYAFDNDFILSMSDDYWIKIWQKEKCVNEYRLPSYKIYTHDGLDSIFIIYDVEFIITVKQFKTGKTIKIFQGHKSSVVCSKLFSKYEYLSCHVDGCIKLWDLETGRCLKTFLENALCIDKINDKQFITGSQDGKFSIWQLNNSKALRKFKCCNYSITNIQVYAKNKFLAYSNGGYLGLWENINDFFERLSKKLMYNLINFRVISNSRIVCYTDNCQAVIWE